MDKRHRFAIDVRAPEEVTPKLINGFKDTLGHFEMSIVEIRGTLAQAEGAGPVFRYEFVVTCPSRTDEQPRWNLPCPEETPETKAWTTYWGQLGASLSPRGFESIVGREAHGEATVTGVSRSIVAATMLARELEACPSIAGVDLRIVDHTSAGSYSFEIVILPSSARR